MREQPPVAQLAAVADKNWASGNMMRLERKHVAAFVVGIAVNKSTGMRQMLRNNSAGPTLIVAVGYHL